MSRLRQLTAEPHVLQADALVEQARQALGQGRRHAARRHLWEALQADPQSVRAWLMLAGLAAPRASLAYARQAVALRPHNPVALRALEWARDRAGERQDPRLKTQDSGAAHAAATVVHGEGLRTLRALDAEATLADVPPPASTAETVVRVQVPHEPPALDAEATLADVPSPASTAETVVRVQVPQDSPAPDPEATFADVPPPASTAETIAHVKLPPAPPAFDPEATFADVPPRAAETVVRGQAPKESPALDVEATLADVPPRPRAAETVPHVELPREAGEAEERLEQTAPRRAVQADSADEEEEERTGPHKAARTGGPANHSALTWLGIVALAALGLFAAAWVWGRAAQPQRAAAVAAAPLEHYLKSTALPPPTATPTVTPSPTASPTFTPTPSITPTPTASPTFTPSPTPPPYQAWAGAGEGRWIDVSLSRQMLTAMEGDTPVRSFVVSTGLWNTPTVQGSFRVYVKYTAADMSGPGYYLPQVPYVMYFHGDYGIHGTYWHSNFGNPMSRGCVNMRTEEAAWLFEWASVGTLVHVHE